MRNFEINPGRPLRGLSGHIDSWSYRRFWKKSQRILDNMETGIYRNGSRYAVVNKSSGGGWITMSDEDMVLGTEVIREIGYELDESSNTLRHISAREERPGINAHPSSPREFMGTPVNFIELGLSRPEVLANLGLVALIAKPEHKEPVTDLLQLPKAS